ncbi:hypothetical protein [Marinibacterium profundimaris]|uniref:Uncharacterized protein n=1 Tax=Marinibacterium profundimaris TaxID=1679460 RepID=A0A225NFS6_9RHOB|nr:hypothetical protein [Marinibacterium profundimaris]OWU72315.1 hypothetical protein ATO3_17415 [Marinibacterium profundimaris]
MTDPVRKHAFPEALLVEHAASGERLLRGIRYRWNTGEAQISWCDAAPADPRALEEEPVRAIAAARRNRPA